MTASPASNPGLAQAHNAEGLAALQAGDALAAMAAFRSAAEADPTAAPLWTNLAHACRLAGRFEDERTALDRALALDQTDFGAQLRKAQLLQRLGEEIAALTTWSGVQQLAAQFPNLPPHIRAELADGQAYCAALEERLYTRIDEGLAGLRPDWDETEQRRIRAFVDTALGRRQVYHNQCAGVHYPFLPEDEFFDRRHFPWLAELEADHAAIRDELRALLATTDPHIRPYVQMEPGSPQNDWSALDGSLDWSACFLYEYGRPNQPVLERCPRTAAALARLPLAQIPGRAPSAFFSILRPRSSIPPHTGVTNTRAIVHLALDVPAGCGFRVGNEVREWVAGEAFAFDDTIEHEAWNRSDEIRTVLIIDTWNPHLSPREQMALQAYFASADTALS